MKGILEYFFQDLERSFLPLFLRQYDYYLSQVDSKIFRLLTEKLSVKVWVPKISHYCCPALHWKDIQVLTSIYELLRKLSVHRS